MRWMLHPKKGNLLLSGLTVTVLCLLCASCAMPNAKAPSVIALDVGQGSSTLIRAAEGDILVDTGREASEERLVLRLRELGVERLALLVLTHGDEDHVGGGDGVLRAFPVDRVWYNGAPADTENSRRLFETARELGVPLVAATVGDGFDLGDWRLTVLFADPTGTQNDSSLVLKLYGNGLSALLMGDATSRVERRLLERYDHAQLSCDVLFIGHHGANDVGDEDFLAAVSPRYTVISCGAGNAYGSPDGRLLERLERAGTAVLRTDLLGETMLYATAEGTLEIQTKE